MAFSTSQGKICGRAWNEQGTAAISSCRLERTSGSVAAGASARSAMRRPFMWTGRSRFSAAMAASSSASLSGQRTPSSASPSRAALTASA